MTFVALPELLILFERDKIVEFRKLNLELVICTCRGQFGQAIRVTLAIMFTEEFEN